MPNYTTDQINQFLWNAIWRTRGRAPNSTDIDYWVNQGKFMECVNYRGLQYAIDRMEGDESSGADIPPYGPHANPPCPYFTPVPPYGSSNPVPAPPSPSNPTIDFTPILNQLNQIIANQNEILTLLKSNNSILTKPAPSYEFDLFGAKVVLHPQG